jgi:hypothetical protein
VKSGIDEAASFLEIAQSDDPRFVKLKIISDVLVPNCLIFRFLFILGLEINEYCVIHNG